ncbi:subtilase family protein [Natranaerovirga pectinivora]|uniref:Subtilase family protein n=1 Tax=Natranaerovirga pectinivora TaxID=682400 RepID=A0A4R3MP14_9FIRM|nr:S8 family peptidase [Natranaerovirga pectinivora]TCT16300.1 subtilase family protein [Natranaerovirga pectinivora]
MNDKEGVNATEAIQVSCREVIVSNEYADLIVQYEGNIATAMSALNGICYQIIDERYAVIHTFRNMITDIPQQLVSAVEFPMQPRLLGPTGLGSIDAAGILIFHTQPYVPLRGRGVIVGFVDSGIDYTHPSFIYEDNTTKILSIWDQSIQEGEPPLNFQYGTEYTEDDINNALASENPFEIVPSIDETGHGTFLAGVAAGRYVDQIAGAAPDADIIMVKLKPGKNYIREIYLLRDDAITYQDNDIMLGINYLMQKAAIYGRPLVICVGLGNNQGAHDGTSVLEEYLSRIARTRGYSVVVSTGNEANLAHHYLGNYPPGEPFQDVEITVAGNERGLNVQIWVQTPDIYSVGIISPTGEVIPRIAPRLRVREEFQLLLERSRVYIEYQRIEEKSGDQLILLRFDLPTQGIWTIRVYGDVVVSGQYNMWMDREGWIQPATQFLRPNFNTTLTLPSTSREPISVGAYNHMDNSVYIGSGRGPTRDGRLKPDLVAPGVNVLGPLPNNTYGTMTGTSVSAAHVAGASALLLEWGIVQGNAPLLNTRLIKKMLMRGATRRPPVVYPNFEWGYGSLNLINSFNILRGTID